MRALDPRDRRERKYVARDQPIEKLRQRRERAVRQVAAPADGDALDQVDDVTLADAIDGAPAPGWQHNAVERALGGPSGRGAGLAVGVEFEEGSDCSLDRISTPTPIRFGRYTHYTHYSYRRVLEPVAVGRNLSPHARDREPVAAGGAERHFFGFASVDIAMRPGARAARLDDQVQTAATGVG